jgi:predicted nucleic acid-binding protein
VSRVFWDTNLFIDLFEDYPDLSDRVTALRRRMISRGDQLCTSTLTLGELLVKPCRAGDEATQRTYEQAVTAAAHVIPFDSGAARRYAALRAADATVRPPDAVQLACAAEARVDLFITNDDRLSQKIVPGIQFLVSLERAFL